MQRCQCERATAAAGGRLIGIAARLIDLRRRTTGPGWLTATPLDFDRSRSRTQQTADESAADTTKCERRRRAGTSKWRQERQQQRSQRRQQQLQPPPRCPPPPSASRASCASPRRCGPQPNSSTIRNGYKARCARSCSRDKVSRGQGETGRAGMQEQQPRLSAVVCAPLPPAELRGCSCSLALESGAVTHCR